MDEKTEQLRDIFVDVSGEETVTESQAETRGSLAGDEGDADAAIADVVADLGERHDFATDLDEEVYVELVHAFYDRVAAGDTDAETDAEEVGDAEFDAAADDAAAIDAALANALGIDAETAFRARLDLHLLCAADIEGPVGLSALRKRGESDSEALADEFDVDVAAVERARVVVAAQDEMRAANHRYREAFDELLTDADLSTGYTDAVKDDGLREAAEDIETNVSF
jgi:hypothetical protein